MRSILQEAPSIPKAIEKAWNDAGQPDEFTVKVFDEGEKNFLGFTKRPAVVSVVFDPKKLEKKNRESVTTERRRDTARPSQPQAPQRWQKDRPQPRQDREERPARGYRGKERQAPHQFPQQEEKRVEEAPRTYNADVWSEEFIHEVDVWLKDMLKVMNIPVSFGIRADRQVLKIDFSEPIFDAPSEERMLFSSFAFILMQFLKRKHKQKLRGCRLAISSRR